MKKYTNILLVLVVSTLIFIGTHLVYVFYTGMFIHHHIVVMEIIKIIGQTVTPWWVDALALLYVVPNIILSESYKKWASLGVAGFLLGYWTTSVWSPGNEYQFLMSISTIRNQLALWTCVWILYCAYINWDEFKKSHLWLVVPFCVVTELLPENTLYYLPAICLQITLVMFSLLPMFFFLCFFDQMNPRKERTGSVEVSAVYVMCGLLVGIFGVQIVPVFLCWEVFPIISKRLFRKIE